MCEIDFDPNNPEETMPNAKEPDSSKFPVDKIVMPCESGRYKCRVKFAKHDIHDVFLYYDEKTNEFYAPGYTYKKVIYNDKILKWERA